MISVGNSNMLRETGGGIFGALFAFVFVSLLGKTGTEIFVILLTIFGIIMLFNLNFGEIIKSIQEKKEERKERKLEKQKMRLEEMEEDEKEANDGKITITNINELKKSNVKDNDNVPISIPEASEYVLPPLNLLMDSKKSKKSNSNELIVSNSKIIEKTLNDFNIIGKVVEVHVGPTVTQYEVELHSGTKVNKVLGINKELALNLCAKEIRIQAPIPGKSTIGIETPSPETTEVRIKDILASIPRKEKDSKLLASLGTDIMGKINIVILQKLHIY